MPSSGEIDNGQPAVLQAYPGGAVGQREIFMPGVIRAAMMEFKTAFFVRR
jgi:hypothetical protein